MPNLPVLLVNGDYDQGLWDANVGLTSTLYAFVDELLASADDNSYARGPSGDDGAVVGFTLQNMPADFLSISSCKASYRYRVSSRVDDTIGIYHRITKSDGVTLLAYGNSINIGDGNWALVGTALTSSTFQNDINNSFPIVDQTATKADWDGAILWIFQRIVQSMSNDGARLEISALEVDGVYTSSIINLTAETAALSLASQSASVSAPSALQRTAAPASLALSLQSPQLTVGPVSITAATVSLLLVAQSAIRTAGPVTMTAAQVDMILGALASQITVGPVTKIAATAQMLLAAIRADEPSYAIDTQDDFSLNTESGERLLVEGFIETNINRTASTVSMTLAAQSAIVTLSSIARSLGISAGLSIPSSGPVAVGAAI